MGKRSIFEPSLFVIAVCNYRYRNQRSSVAERYHSFPDRLGIMWLLTSRWSNPMKHLIPYLQDDQKAADYLRQLRWPDGVMCPRCGSDAVEPRERCDNGLQRFNCGHCAARLGQQFAMFTDWTSSIFEESKLRPLEWLLVMGLWQLKLNATEIAAAADIQERTAQRCINLLDGGIYETYHLDPTRHLEHQVEADECYQSAGSKGQPRAVERHDRAPRQRGLQLRGRARRASVSRSARERAHRDDQTHHCRQGEKWVSILHRRIQHLPFH